MFWKRRNVVLFSFLTAFLLFSHDALASQAELSETAAPPAAQESYSGLVRSADGKICCYERGILAVNCLKTVDSKLYYFTADGSALTDSWKDTGGYRYYFGSDGCAYTGSRLIGSCYYIFDEECRLSKTGKKHIAVYGSRKYYVDRNGRAIPGWNIVSSNVIYASESGRLAADKKVSYIKFNAQGFAVNKYQAVAKIYARKFINKHTRQGWSRKRKLRACFYYLLSHRSYVAHNVSDHRAYKTNTWQYKAAVEILASRHLTGNCRNFAAAFAAIARELGYQPYVWSMKTHSVVKIGNSFYDSLYGRGLFEGRRRTNYVKANKFKF